MNLELYSTSIMIWQSSDGLVAPLIEDSARNEYEQAYVIYSVAVRFRTADESYVVGIHPTHIHLYSSFDRADALVIITHPGPCIHWQGHHDITKQ